MYHVLKGLRFSQSLHCILAYRYIPGALTRAVHLLIWQSILISIAPYIVNFLSWILQQDTYGRFWQRNTKHFAMKNYENRLKCTMFWMLEGLPKILTMQISHTWSADQSCPFRSLVVYANRKEGGQHSRPKPS